MLLRDIKLLWWRIFTWGGGFFRWSHLGWWTCELLVRYGNELVDVYRFYFGCVHNNHLLFLFIVFSRLDHFTLTSCYKPLSQKEILPPSGVKWHSFFLRIVMWNKVRLRLAAVAQVKQGICCVSLVGKGPSECPALTTSHTNYSSSFLQDLKNWIFFFLVTNTYIYVVHRSHGCRYGDWTGRGCANQNDIVK